MSAVSSEDTRNTGVDNLLIATNIDEVALAAADLASLGPDVYDSTIEEYARRVVEEGRDRSIVDFAENLRDVSRVVIEHEVRAGRSGRFASSVIIQNETAREFHQGGDYCTDDLVVYGLDYHAKFTDRDVASRAAGLLANLKRSTGGAEAELGHSDTRDFYLKLSVPEREAAVSNEPTIEVVRDDVVRVNGQFVKLNKHQVFLLNVLMESGGNPLAAADFRERGFGAGLKPSTIGTRLSAEKSKLVQELNAAMPGLLVEMGGRRDRQITITNTNVTECY